MCGINGMVSYPDQRQISKEVLIRMRDIMLYRGPDDAGLFISNGVGLGSRRLAIIDLSEQGHMPMASQDGRYWIVYNGEIYNYRELRADLRDRGVQFRSQTDTEVVLELFKLYGADMLSRMNGMFAIAIWDQQERQLFLARDRMGVKPLVYAMYNGTFYFASEEKALFAAGVPLEFDHDCWEELLCFRFIAGENTIYKRIKRLLPGHFLTLHEGQVVIRRWWKLANRIQESREQIPHDPAGWYRETFDDAIRGRMISDVPLGVLLSGGMDSSSVTASVALQAESGVHSFTVRFEEPGYDEGRFARAMVDKYRLTGNELVVKPEALFEGLDQAAWYNNGPLVHSSDSHLLAIARYARPRVTVLLNGEGADETLGGYIRYQPLRFPALLEMARTPIGQFGLSGGNGRKAKLARFLHLGETSLFVLFNACEVLPDELAVLGIHPENHYEYRESVLQEAEQIYPREYARQAMYSDLHTFLCSLLDRNDRMTMGASIECREPFLDYRLVEMTAALPSYLIFNGLRTKPLLRKSMRGRLPREVQGHRKWGFGVPWKQYLREIPEFREQLRNIPRNDLIRNSPIDQKAAAGCVMDFLNGNEENAALVQQLFMIVFCLDGIRNGIKQFTSSNHLV